MIFTSSALSRVRMVFGVPAGARIPYQVVTSKFGSPASAAVGTSGSAGARCGATRARARSFPALMCGATAGTPITTSWIWPASTSFIARFKGVNLAMNDVLAGQIQLVVIGVHRQVHALVGHVHELHSCGDVEELVP